MELPHLVLDIGNTKIAGALFEGDHIKTKFRFKRGDHWQRVLAEVIENCGNCKKALVSSVVPALDLPILNILKQQDIDGQLVLESKLPIGNKGQGVGSDRLADACGAVKLYGDNIITVSLGTALVFNIVQERTFCGGVIAPGMGMGVRALAEHCAMLPLVDVKRPKEICSLTTEGNIQSGVYYGILGAIERIIHGLQHECFPKKNAPVIMTGGVFSKNKEESTVLGNQLKRDLAGVVDLLSIDLTLIGLNEIFKCQCR